jgi:predicted PurR-regulated permease PerM
MMKANALSSWQRAVIMMAWTVVAGVVIAALYLAQEILVPLALAIFLTFLLSPLVTALQRRGLRRVPSVLVIAVLAAALLFGVGWVMTQQVSALVESLPKYSKNIKEKIQSLREMTEGGAAGKFGQLLDEISGLQGKPSDKETAPKEGGAAGAAPPDRVVVREKPAGWLAEPLAALSSVSKVLAFFGLTAVLVLFMLLKREDLRNRLLRLAGHGRLTVMTKAVDEAGQRISRFLLMQAVINAGYGVVVAVALSLLGVERAILWGMLAALLRYVPYLGVWIAILPPILLSLAQFEGWWQPSLVIALYVVLELFTVNLLEPRLFGQSMGVSEVALLVAAAFWAWMWGPVGLVLSSPLTVVLVVLGKYVPHLEFLDVLLGDEPPLEPDVSFYQRLLARDQDEATDLALAQAKMSGRERVFDELLVPALAYSRRDREQDKLTEADEHFIQLATSEIIEELDERQTDREAEGPAAPAGPKVSILGCPARDEEDRLALEMLQQLLDPARWELEIVGGETLTSELLIRAANEKPAVICIGAIPPGGLAHTRYLCKRLRQRLPDVKIVVGRWGLRGHVERNVEQLREAGADQIDTKLLETRDHLRAWLPVLAGLEARASADGESKAADRVGPRGAAGEPKAATAVTS